MKLWQWTSARPISSTRLLLWLLVLAGLPRFWTSGIDRHKSMDQLPWAPTATQSSTMALVLICIQDIRLYWWILFLLFWPCVQLDLASGLSESGLSDVSVMSNEWWKGHSVSYTKCKWPARPSATCLELHVIHVIVQHVFWKPNHWFMSNMLYGVANVTNCFWSVELR